MCVKDVVNIMLLLRMFTIVCTIIFPYKKLNDFYFETASKFHSGFSTENVFQRHPNEKQFTWLL